MKKISLILVFISIVSFTAKAQTVPAKVKNYLKVNYPNWVIGKSWVVDSKPLTAIVSGDFNGDGEKDYAVLITKDDRVYALALLANKHSFKAINMLTQKDGNERWIAGIDVTEKGTEVFVHNDRGDVIKKVKLKTDGINVYDGERMSHIFYLENGKFLVGQDF
jgi:hypothetical protein